MFRPLNIERIKTIFIVVLFMMTILLFYFLWKDISFGGIKLPLDFLGQGTTVVVPDTNQIIVPDAISVNFGGGNYTKITRNTNEYWLSFRNELNKFGETQNIAITEITKAQYEKVNSFRSIEVDFNFWLPFVASCNALDIKTQSNYGSIDAVSKVAYSSASPESILIYDGKNNKYYRMATAKDVTKIKDLITNIETKEKGKFYQLGAYLGIGNSTLMPVSTTSQMKKIGYNEELFVSTPNSMLSFEESFFGKGFDFVRKITENDNTTIYMYGYGKKILIINSNGKFEYKEELNDTDYNETSYFDSFDLAVKFISTHGGWNTINGNQISPRLVSAKETLNSGKKGYKFTFEATVLGEPVNYEGSTYPLSVEMTGSQIINYQRELLDIRATEIEELSDTKEKSAIAPIDIISKQYTYINQILSKEGIQVVGKTEDKLFEFTALRISDIKTGYFRTKEDSTTTIKFLIPAWIIELNNIQIYFDLYDGKALGYSKSN
ncbi:MAG: two-component system activity regulator YycH [Eubacteriales bacterium]